MDNDPDLNKLCWVCFEDDVSASWVKPCRCKGTSKWAHHMCLQRWIEEKQNGNTFVKVECRLCLTQYNISYPPLDLLTKILERVNRFGVYFKAYSTTVVFFGSIYLIAVTYGTITLFIVYGDSDGQALMSAYAPVLLVALPFVPDAINFIALQSIKWEDVMVRFFTRITTASGVGQPVVGQLPAAAAVANHTYTYSLNCTCLALPLFGKIVGDILLKNQVESPLWRALLGGAICLGIKSAANVYLEFRQVKRRQHCMIVDFVEPNNFRN